MNRILIALTSLALLLAACGEDNSVGNDATFEFDQQQAEALGGSTTTTAAPTEDTVPEATTTTVDGATNTTVAQQQATTTLPPEQQEVSIEVLIQEDSSGQAFKERIVAVPVGGKVRFVNATSVPRSVVADNGAFDSGPIAPGAVWIWTANAPGTYNYTDGTRPYAVGTVDVVQ